MKTLVVYYSRTGNTEKVAKEIAKALKADVEQILDTKSRAGFFGWLMAGKESTRKVIPQIKGTKKDVSKFELVIIGTPIWAFTLASPVRAYLAKFGGNLKRAAFFATEGGSGDEKAFKAMAELAGKPIATLTVRTNEVANGSYVKLVKGFASQLRKI